ncbi:MAG TPA: DUF1643 domain-containing protein [Methanocella sp.]|jgi:hypothetical protein
MSFLEQGATFSEDRLYRYNLWRRWESKSSGKVTFVMLNPSTADAEKFDPTVRRCFGYACDWGFGSMEVVNLFALRSTYPEVLSKAADPVGPENDAVILKAVKESDLTIAAWGIHGPLRGRDREVLEMIASVRDLHCLGTTKDRHPLHPLHQPKRLRPVPYSGDLLNRPANKC